MMLTIHVDGKCEYMWRMQNTVDHTNVEELAGVLGAKFDGFRNENDEKACGDACDVMS
jgi:hypothetical protein